MTETLESSGRETMLEVIDVLDHYAWSFDTSNVSKLTSLFTEDGVKSGRVADTDVAWGPWRGRDEIARELIAVRERHPTWRRHQITTPVFIEVGDNHAIVKAYLSVFSCADGRTPTIEVTGEYLAKVVNIDGSWKIDTLEAILDSEI